MWTGLAQDVDAPERLIIWLLGWTDNLANIFEGMWPSYRYFQKSSFSRGKPECSGIISDYSSDVLAFLIGWDRGQLPCWPAS